MVEKIKYRNIDEEDFRKYFRHLSEKITVSDLDDGLIADIQNSAAGAYNDSVLRSDFQKKLDLKLDISSANSKYATKTDLNSLKTTVTAINAALGNTVDQDALNNFAVKTDVKYDDGSTVKSHISALETASSTYLKNQDGVITYNLLNNDVKTKIDSKLTATSADYELVKSGVANNLASINNIVSFLSKLNYAVGSINDVVVKDTQLSSTMQDLPARIDNLQSEINDIIASLGSVSTGNTGGSSTGNDLGSMAYQDLYSKDASRDNGMLFFTEIERNRSGTIQSAKLKTDYMFRSDVVIIRDNTNLTSSKIVALSELYDFLLYLPNKNDMMDGSIVYYFDNEGKWRDVSTIGDGDVDVALKEFTFEDFEGRFIKEYDTDSMYFVVRETASSALCATAVDSIKAKEIDSSIFGLGSRMSAAEKNISTIQNTTIPALKKDLEDSKIVFTDAQSKALNSGMTSAKLAEFNGYATSKADMTAVKELLTQVIDIIVKDSTDKYNAKVKVEQY